jgi:hypothetical protein
MAILIPILGSLYGNGDPFVSNPRTVTDSPHVEMGTRQSSFPYRDPHMETGIMNISIPIWKRRLTISIWGYVNPRSHIGIPVW